VVTWEPPSRETWNGNLLGYHVGYQEVSTEESNNVAQSYTFKSVEVRPHFGGEAVLQGLSKYTTYGIIVQVRLLPVGSLQRRQLVGCSKAYNSRGSGPASDPVTARTLEDAPTLPPLNVQCSVLSAQSLHISWEPPLPEGRNGIIQGYKVTYHSAGEWFGRVVGSGFFNRSNCGACRQRRPTDEDHQSAAHHHLRLEETHEL
jgi:Down syndrome cell adhesion protein